MKIQRILQTLLTTLLLVTIFESSAFPSDWSFTPNSFDAKNLELNTRYDALMEIIPKSLTKTGTSAFRKPMKLSKNRAAMRREYLELREAKLKYDKITQLKNDLIEKYKNGATGSYDQAALNREAITLATGLLDETVRLRDKYSSFFIPIFHNMMIDVGIKKRGACKHWAEDLLSYLRTIDRQYFSVTWGEAHARKFTEHNVAVIFPNNGNFKDGILFDPWRTSGIPFWVGVTRDPHYAWREWAEYGEY